MNKQICWKLNFFTEKLMRDIYMPSHREGLQYVGRLFLWLPIAQENILNILHRSVVENTWKLSKCLFPSASNVSSFST